MNLCTHGFQGCSFLLPDPGCGLAPQNMMYLEYLSIYIYMSAVHQSLSTGPASSEGLPCLQMGPSGSGKTTLLDILAGRKSVGQIKGTMLFNGSKPTSNFLSRHTGYVEQFGQSLCSLAVVIQRASALSPCHDQCFCHKCYG